MADAAAPDPGDTTSPASAADGGALSQGDDGGSSFYEGYNEIVENFDETSADEQVLERFRSLKETRGDCDSLETSVKALEADLARARQQTKASIEEDSTHQKEVDERMNVM